MADDFAVAAVEGDLAAFSLRDHAKAVILIFENPPGIVEGRVG
jgi:hypothetical protein